MMDAGDSADAKSKILAPATGRPFSQKAISEHRRRLGTCKDLPRLGGRLRNLAIKALAAEPRCESLSQPAARQLDQLALNAHQI